jgi:hypothetical protein
MILSWRELFIKYNEPYSIKDEKREDLSLPPDMKDKLRDLITKNIERDIKKAK